MDEIDRKILKLLQDNARVSLKTIAENTFLSSPAVSARIERLEKEGIITGYHASVDPVKLGYHILAYINLEVIPEDKAQVLRAMPGKCPMCWSAAVSPEDFSMLMKVAFQSTMELDMFIGQLAEVR
ncbi:MAG: Lrp/AsnC family transcriptional regulator [Enterocloster bolteae]